MLVSRYAPKAPAAAEREYLRMANALAADVMKPVLREKLPELMSILRNADNAETRADAKGKIAKRNAKERSESRLAALASASSEIDAWFAEVKEALEKSLRTYGLASKLDAMAKLTGKLALKEWKKAVSRTLGINILEDYYSGSYYGGQLEKWINDNVGLISTLPEDMLTRMKKTVMEGYVEGRPVSQLAKDIEHDYSVTKSHARLIARDQTAKLNSQISQYQQRRSGVRRYRWSTSLDGDRVRDDHQVLEGKDFSWDSPPEIGSTGRRCHPGEDYQCRCVALPIFDLDTLDVALDINGE